MTDSRFFTGSESVLLPCPFCGGEAGYFASGYAVFRAEWTGHVYHCTTCQGRVQNTDRQTAQAMWNARAGIHGVAQGQSERGEMERQIEQILFGRIMRNRLEGYTVETAKEIMGLLGIAQAGTDRDAIARIVYDAFPFDARIGQAQKPAWVDGGNSMRQDDARRAADAIMALRAPRSGHQSPPDAASSLPSGESDPSVMTDSSGGETCRYCNGSKRALYFTEQGLAQEWRDCHVCSIPSTDRT